MIKFLLTVMISMSTTLDRDGYEYYRIYNPTGKVLECYVESLPNYPYYYNDFYVRSYSYSSWFPQPNTKYRWRCY